MLRRISSSSIIISIALLALASVTVLGQSSPPLDTFSIATNDGALRGIIFTGAAGTSTQATGTIWSQADAAQQESALTFTGSDGTALRGIIYTGVTAAMPGATIWSAPVASTDSEPAGGAGQTVLLYDLAGKFRGIVSTGTGAPSFKGIIFLDSKATIWSTK